MDRLMARWQACRLKLRQWLLLGALRARPDYYELVSGLITALVIINAISTGVDVGNVSWETYARTRLADDIEQMVDQWSDSIDERARAHRIYAGQGISEYRASLERELLSQFRPQAQALADRIRNARDEDLAKFGMGQVLQQITASFGGKYVGGALGKNAGDAVGNLLEWEWNAASLAQAYGGEDLSVNWQAKSDLMRQMMGHLAGRELSSWNNAEPLLQAMALRTVRYLQLNRDQWTDEEYEQLVRQRAMALAGTYGLTRGRSEDAPFKDIDALMGWLAGQAGRALPGQEPTPTGPPPEPTATNTAVPQEPEAAGLNATRELGRLLYNTCSSAEMACSDALCAGQEYDGMCDDGCPACDSDIMYAMCDPDLWDLDDQAATCSLAAAEEYVRSVVAALNALTTGTIKESEALQAETRARYTAMDANEKCIATVCKSYCGMQGQDYALVYGMCKCK